MKICVVAAGSLGCTIQGPLAKIGLYERCNVPTPVNETLVAAIKGIEARMRVEAAATRALPQPKL